MAREVIGAADLHALSGFDGDAESSGGGGGLGTAGAAGVDGYRDRLVKYIPAEVVAVFMTIDGILRSTERDRPLMVLGWLVFVFLLAMTPVYLSRLQGVTKRQQLAISTAAFAVWVFALGGPFLDFAWYRPIYGAILLPLFTFSAAVWEAR